MKTVIIATLPFFNKSRAGAVYKKPTPDKPAFTFPHQQLRTWLIGSVVCLLIIGLGYWLSRPATFPIRMIQVSGVQQNADVSLRYVDTDLLRERVGNLTNRGFFRANLDAIQAAVRSLPWVKNSRVQRIWPDTLAISITEYRPIAYWQVLDAQETDIPQLLDETGRTFTAENAALPALPILSGPTGEQETAISLYQQISVAITPTSLEISQLRYRAGPGWQLSLHNGLLLQLGHQPDTLMLERFVRVYRTHLNNQLAQIAEIDLRYTQSVAVRWKNDGENPENVKNTSHSTP